MIVNPDFDFLLCLVHKGQKQPHHFNQATQIKTQTYINLYSIQLPCY